MNPNSHTLNTVELNNTKALILSGPLGSGKTTFLTLLLKTQREALGNIGLIINDVGLNNIDTERLSQEDIKALTDGCICCDDINQLGEHIEDLAQKRDTIIIEPTGIADPEHIKALLLQNHIRTKILTLVPYSHLEKIDTIPALKKIFEAQADEADILGISRYDHYEEEAVSIIKTRYPKKEVVLLPFAPHISGEIFEDNDQIYTQLNTIAHHLLHHHTSHTMCQTGCTDHHQHTHQHDHGDHTHHHHEHTDHGTKTVTYYLSEEITPKQLKTILFDTPGIIRAKGTLKGEDGKWHHYNYTLGDFALGEVSSLHIPSNIIGLTDTDMDQLTHLKHPDQSLRSEEKYTGVQLENSHTPLDFYKTATEEELMKNAHKRYLNLKEQYNHYMELYETKQVVESTIKDQNTLGQEEQEETLHQIQFIEAKLKEIGDAMTFEDPIIWMMYKHLAYSNTPTAISTIDELFAHCFKQPGYICGKRYTYLAQRFEEMHHQPLFGSEHAAFAKNTPLEDIYTDSRVIALLKDTSTLFKWQSHEFYISRDRVAKWENYA